MMDDYTFAKNEDEPIPCKKSILEVPSTLISMIVMNI